jgi:putative membrane protein
MSRIIGYIVLLLILLLVLFFTLLNTDAIRINYHFGIIEGPLSLVLLVAVLAGTMLGIVASLGIIIRHRRELARLKRQIKNTATEVANLRNMPIKDDR